MKMTDAELGLFGLICVSHTLTSVAADLYERFVTSQFGNWVSNKKTVAIIQTVDNKCIEMYIYLYV